MVKCFIDWILDTELSPRPITLLTPHIPTLTNKTSIYSVNIILYTTEYQSSFKKGSWWKKCISLIFYFIFFFVIFFLSLLNKLWWLWVVKVWCILWVWVIGCILFINETMLAIWTEMNNGVFINLRWSWFLHHQFVIISFCYNFEQKQNLEIFTETGTGGGGVGAAARRNCNPDNFISLPQPPHPAVILHPCTNLANLQSFSSPDMNQANTFYLKDLGNIF